MTNPKELVKRIKGNRKNLNEPNYLHSYRVYNMLNDDGYDKDVCIAWLLHDILEDSDVTVMNLHMMWYSQRIIDLIVACTHDEKYDDSWTKWRKMIDEIDQRGDTDALIIKIADLTDNMKTCHLLKPKSYYNFLYKKAPKIMELIYKHLDNADFDTTKLKVKFFEARNDQKMFYNKW